MYIRNPDKNLLGIFETSVVYEENSSAKCIAEMTESTENRLLITKKYVIRQTAVKANKIELLPVPGNFQIADILTKATDVDVCNNLCPYAVKRLSSITG